jgi:hypothetical protein
VVEALPVFDPPTAAIQPGGRLLDDLAFWQHYKTSGLIGAFDDLDVYLREDGFHGRTELGGVIPAVGA